MAYSEDLALRKQAVAKGAPAVIRTWTRILAVGCSHGDLAHPDRLSEVLAFKQTFQPKHVIELGDVIDTAAFRSGAKGTKDETVPVSDDRMAAIRWIEAYQPTVITWGNHCNRLVNWMGHPNAIVADCARMTWNALNDAAARVGALTIPYDIDEGWYSLGGVYWGHGYMFNEQFVRDHAEMLGGPCVIAHGHVPQQVPGRVRGSQPSFCVGMLGDRKKMNYARLRRNTSRWNAGAVWGEICENESRLWLASAQGHGPIQFPNL